MYINTSEASPAPERYHISTYIEILLRGRRSIQIDFSGSIYINHSGAGEVFLHASPGPEKCLYTLLWRRGAFIYTPRSILRNHYCLLSTEL